jgi:hypothetical protein
MLESFCVTHSTTIVDGCLPYALISPIALKEPLSLWPNQEKPFQLPNPLNPVE